MVAWFLNSHQYCLCRKNIKNKQQRTKPPKWTKKSLRGIKCGDYARYKGWRYSFSPYNFTTSTFKSCYRVWVKRSLWSCTLYLLLNAKGTRNFSLQKSLIAWSWVQPELSLSTSPKRKAIKVLFFICHTWRFMWGRQENLCLAMWPLNVLFSHWHHCSSVKSNLQLA